MTVDTPLCGCIRCVDARAVGLTGLEELVVFGVLLAVWVGLLWLAWATADTRCDMYVVQYPHPCATRAGFVSHAPDDPKPTAPGPTP